MNKHELIANLRDELQALAQRRRAARLEPAIQAARVALQQFQAARMAATHADLLAAPESAAAAHFFLDDLYGAKNVTERDADVERVLPTVERMLPQPALAAIAQAVELDALSDVLDAAMAARLGVHFDQYDYAAAYRETAVRSERERQLQYVESVGQSLCSLVRIPLVGATLAMMRGPAKVAGLAELQHFLERGFKAFKAMPRPQEFVAAIVARERQISANLYASRAEPFVL